MVISEWRKNARDCLNEKVNIGCNGGTKIENTEYLSDTVKAIECETKKKQQTTEGIMKVFLNFINYLFKWIVPMLFKLHLFDVEFDCLVLTIFCGLSNET